MNTHAALRDAAIPRLGRLAFAGAMALLMVSSLMVAPASADNHPEALEAWSNYWEGTTDGLYVRWSTPIAGNAPGGGDGYTVHQAADCSDEAIATGVETFWAPGRPNIRDLPVDNPDAIVQGETYYLHVAAGTERNVVDGEFVYNEEECFAFVAEVRAGFGGRVTDAETGAAIPGATVTVFDDGVQVGEQTTVRTSPNPDQIGGYRIEGLPAGTYDVTTSAEGYESQTQTLTLEPGFLDGVNFALQSGDGGPGTGAISGQVTDAASGGPIEGAMVMADGASAMTGADGSYLIDELAAGDYSVTADADGYVADSQTVTVTEGATATADFALEADEDPAGVQCGDVLTEDTTLTEDLGPCPGHGLIIGADNVTLNLDGHEIIGDPQARSEGELMQGSRDRAGVLFRQVTGSMVMGGTVRGFDAGVAIMGGGDNTAHFMTLVDNINYRVVTGADADPGMDTPTCLFGEGLVMFNSSGNTVEDNTLTNNGPISGIAMVGNSDNNTVQRNTLSDHDVINQTRDEDPRNTICGTGPEQGPMTTGRQVMNIGIRIEGPGASNNVVRDNEVTRSSIAGIAIHGYVCAENDAGAPIAENNGGNEIVGNTVTRTGERTVELDALADGIAVLATGPADTVCVSHSNTISGNTATDNLRDGINLGGRGSHSNVINDNVVDDNARNGITVAGPANNLPGAINNTLHGNSGHGNGTFDGADFNPDCDENDWQNSDFGTVNQECVRGTQVGPEPGAITGTVTDADGEPIEGATVTADGESATTDADGMFTIEDLEAGEYTVTADAEGFQEASQTVTVEEGETATADFTLEADEVEPEPDDPQSKNDCKKGGWEDYGFRNQGQCIRYVNTGQDSRL